MGACLSLIDAGIWVHRELEGEGRDDLKCLDRHNEARSPWLFKGSTAESKEGMLPWREEETLDMMATVEEVNNCSKGQ